MSEDSPATPPESRRPSAGPMAPRWAITLALLVVLGYMGLSAFREDYKSMIVSALVVLSILGADIGALLRSWRGGGSG